jgi:hypothetical protein
MDAEIGGKRVELLRELIPNLSRIAVLATTSTTSPFGPPFVEDLRLAATSASLGFKPILIGGSSEFRSAFAEMGKANVQAVKKTGALAALLESPQKSGSGRPAFLPTPVTARFWPDDCASSSRHAGGKSETCFAFESPKERRFATT